MNVGEAMNAALIYKNQALEAPDYVNRHMLACMAWGICLMLRNPKVVKLNAAQNRELQTIVDVVGRLIADTQKAMK